MAARKGVDAIVDFRGGELGGQSEVEAALVSCSPALVGGGEGGLGFAGAHRSLDDIKAGAVGGFQKSLLERRGGK